MYERTKPSEDKLSENFTLIKLGNMLLEDGNDTKAEWCFHKTLCQYNAGDEIDNEFAGLLYYKIGTIQHCYISKKLNVSFANCRTKIQENQRTNSVFNYLYLRFILTLILFNIKMLDLRKL